MSHRLAVVLATAALVVAGALGAPTDLAGAAPPEAGDPVGPTVFVGDLTVDQLGLLRRSGLDREDIAVRRAAGAAARAGRVGVEVVAERSLARKLVAQGLPLAEKKVDGTAVSKRLRGERPAATRCSAPTASPGGIRDELIGRRRQPPRAHQAGHDRQDGAGPGHPGDQGHQGRQQGRATARRPAVLYSSAQHAREWITPEMNRRLLHYYLDSYATDPKIRRIVDTTELWFVPVANPDGYDYTFTEGNRLWRKNLRDNDGDGEITGVDGVDLNRNYPYQLGLRQRGLLAVAAQRDLPRHRARPPSRRPRRWTA